MARGIRFTGSDPAGRSAAAARIAPPGAALAALAGLLWAALGGFRPIWPLAVVAALLVLGLLASSLARITGHGVARRLAPPLTAVAGMLLVTFWLPNAHSHWHVSPLWVVALPLCLAMTAGRLANYDGSQPALRIAQPAAAITAVLLLMWELSVDHTWFYTFSPGTLHSADELPIGALRIIVTLLCLGLSADRLINRRALHRLLLPSATIVALLILVSVMAFPSTAHLRPEWPLLWAAVALALGLAAVPVARVAALPGARVLAERVDELSRTRSGALDVQATELRRIERDLHDGAQVRLVALSMKLGRAEDRYRDDPETAALLREAREDATAAIRELRELARGIAPPVLADRGLEAAVTSLAQRSGVEATVSAQLRRRPVPAVETAAYFVVAESLTNAVKHADGARVEIRLTERGQDLVVNISDFGPGGADPTGGGLTGLRQRVEALDGFLRVRSASGLGTQVEAVMPCGR